MTKLSCPLDGCDYETEAEDAAGAAAQLTIHGISHTTGPSASRAKLPSMARPVISRSSTAEEWQIFLMKWEDFKKGTEIPDSLIKSHLWQCCEISLANDLFKQVGDFNQVSEGDLLKAIESLAVVKIATTMRTVSLLSAQQDQGQPFSAFLAEVKASARICSFYMDCSRQGCTQVNDYTDRIVKHVIISGLADDELRRQVLSVENLDKKSLDETAHIIENKDMAIRATSSAMRNQHSSSVAASTSTGQPSSDLSNKLSQVVKCTKCGNDMKKYKLLQGKFGKPRLREFKQCIACWKQSKQSETPSVGSNIASISHRSNNTVKSTNCAVQRPQPEPHCPEVLLDHHIFDGTYGWLLKECKAQPTIDLLVSTRQADYAHFSIQRPKISPRKVKAVSDTGAQSSLMGLKLFRACGLTDKHLIPVKKRMFAANDECIHILGAVFLRLSGATAAGDIVETAEMVYITDSTKLFYLSRHAMEQLRIIGPDFPRIGAAALHATQEPTHEGNTHQTCSCPQRSTPPPRPQRLPFEPCAENIDKMKQWLLERFASSTFNKCKHRPLPTMTGPPISIHIDPSATPTAVHTPAAIPLHWKDEIEKQLEADIKLGVIEKVEPNTPTTWCHRAIWVRKADGSPRRVVDFQSLNRFCSRDTHHVVPPFKQARSIPPNTYRSVTDAWNGYHSVPVREQDRHLLTFITEFGRYRYRVAPQGYLASGDGYAYRYDSIIADTLRKTKCVDDTVLWDDELATHWWRMIDYLELMGREGIILNASKFQFCRKHIEFAGFEITAEDVRPLPKYLEAIQCFPRPKKIADVRAWFGLVNQVSHYGRLTTIMAPFKPLLSTKTPFCWTSELDDAFANSKLELINAIKDGVRIFDSTRRTCLTPDWSKSGIGYWLRQKHCNCASLTPDCCDHGWKITLAGSRFLRSAEQRYAPVEGEALAVAWALEDTKFFTLGCDDLIVCTDHKPLVKIFGDRSLDEITNTRIFRLKQRTLSWRFRVVHVPGKLIPASDAFSRHPAPSESTLADDTPLDHCDSIIATHDDTNLIENSIVAASRASLNAIEVVSWDDVKRSTVYDPVLCELKHYILSGFPDKSDKLPLQLQSYWRYRDNLSIVDDVVMYNDRIVIPPPLRGVVCDILHSAHQGTAAMSQRAQATVFWPGMTECIARTRARCDNCSTMAPSQAHMPPAEPFIPTYPFQAIAADYCTAAGHHYLVVVDRFSNWPEIFHIHRGGETSGALGLQDTLRGYFSTFGVAEELSSDGGPEFAAYSTQEFFRKWGVRHRLSSAYHSRSNGRAEAGVKSMKRLLLGNISQDGSIRTDALTRALLQFRNCPDPANGLSPAEIVFGRTLKDALPIKAWVPVFTQRDIRPLWRNLWQSREHTLRTRFAKQLESLSLNTKSLPPLSEGDVCRIQNQNGRYPLRWDRTGTVVQCRDHDQYLVKVDGSGRLTLRNRKFLRKIEPYFPNQKYPFFQPTVLSPGTATPQVAMPPQVAMSPQVATSPQIAMPPQVATPPRVGRSDQVAEPSAEDHQPVEEPVDDTSIAPPSNDGRRGSGRNVTPPVWHKDYVIGAQTLC